MTQDEARELPLGLYRIFWKTGGSSLAAVGQLYDGTRWFAPTNWTAADNFMTSINWKIVEKVKLIKTNDGGVAEWSKAPVLKTGEPRGSASSNLRSLRQK